MKKTELQIRLEGMTPAQREQFLTDNADNVLSEQHYRRELDEDEMAQAKHNHTHQSIVLAMETEAFDILRKDFNAKKKELASDIRYELNKVRQGFEEATGNLYYCADHENNMMEVYDSEGNLVEHRKLRPNEKQLTINAAKTANS